MTPYLAAVAPAPPPSPSPRPGEADVIVIIDRPEPANNNPLKSTGDSAAGDLTIESCGRLPLHQPGQPSRSSRSVC
jgi:hypothetical protein